MISLSVVQTKVFDDLMDMVKNPNFFPGWANRRGMAIYAQAQMDRWQTEGGSEGVPWASLNSVYEKRKKIVFQSYFGQGTKKLIASSRLLASVLPPKYRDGPIASHGEEFRKTVTDRSLIIATAVPYSIFVNQARPFSMWSDDTWKKFASSLKRYLKRAIKNRSK